MVCISSSLDSPALVGFAIEQGFVSKHGNRSNKCQQLRALRAPPSGDPSVSFEFWHFTLE